MLTLAQFKVYANLNTPLDANQEVFVSDMLANINEQIERETGALFKLVTIDDSNPDPRFKKRDVQGCNLNILMIGAWQQAGLTVQVGSRFGKNNMRLLTSEVDYNVIPFDNAYLPGYDYPIVGLEFPRRIRDNEVIRLTGTYGFSNGLPADLQQLLYQIANRSDYNRHMSTNILAIQEVAKMLRKYKNLLRQKVTIS